MSEINFKPLIILIGVTSMLTQLVLLRELFRTFTGNELVVGVVLAMWLLLTGLGSVLGRQTSGHHKQFRHIFFIMSGLPLVLLFVLRWIAGNMFLPGEVPGLSDVFFVVILILAPYCILSGYMFVLSSMVLSKKKNLTSVSEVYFFDNMGMLFGGFIFSLVLINILNAVHIFVLMLAVNIFLFFYTYRDIRLWKMIVAGLILVVLLANAMQLEEISVSLAYAGQDVVHIKDSKYGHVVVTELGDEYNFYLDSMPLFSTGVVEDNEVVIHPGMSQRLDIKRVLVIGGGVSGTLKEVLKHDVMSIDYIDIDPVVIDAGMRYTDNLLNGKINLIIADGREYVKNYDGALYDVVIVDIPDPSNSLLNRFYTFEFFEEVKSIMTDTGVLSLSLSSSPNYLNDETISINAALYKTLLGIFRDVEVIPASSNIFLASDTGITVFIPNRLEQKGIDTVYVNDDYFSDILSVERLSFIDENIKKGLSDVKVNHDFMPVAYYYGLLSWLSEFGVSVGLIVLLILVFAIVAVAWTWKEGPITFCIFSTGFSGMGLMVILLLAYQTLYGQLYHQVSLLIASFMLGLVLGANYVKKADFKLFKIDFAIVMYALLLPVVFVMLSRMDSMMGYAFTFLALLLGFLVGMQFPLAVKEYGGGVSHNASTIDAMDQFGSALGAIVIAVFLIPLMGVVMVCGLLASVNLMSAMLLMLKK